MKAEFQFTRRQLLILVSVGVFIIVCCSLIFSNFFLGSNRALVERTEKRVAHVLETLVAYERQHGLKKLIELAQDRKLWGEREDPFLSIKHVTGITILHTSNLVPPQEAWRAASRSIRSFIVGRGLFTRRVHVATAPLTSGTLLVGQSEVSAAQTRDMLFVAFVLLLAAALSVAWFAAALLSRQSRKSVEEMKAALFAFAAGDVERRVMIPSVDTPLADLAQAINGSLGYSRTLIENLNNTSSDIAHNLKKPLTRLRQRLELASKCEAGNPEFSGKIDECIQEIDALVAMFEALLNFGQLQSGDWRLRFVDVDMVALLTHIIDIYEPIIADHGLKLEASIPQSHVYPVRGDRELLMEMIVNFLENAIQYCPSGTTLRIDMLQCADGLGITVSDNGPGVPASEIENLFQRFYRLEASRDKPGYGLGIPFAVAIAELHGARIELSDNKPGLKVFIHFPNIPDTKRPRLGLRLRSAYVVKGLTKS